MRDVYRLLHRSVLQIFFTTVSFTPSEHNFSHIKVLVSPHSESLEEWYCKGNSFFTFHCVIMIHIKIKIKIHAETTEELKLVRSTPYIKNTLKIRVWCCILPSFSFKNVSTGCQADCRADLYSSEPDILSQVDYCRSINRQSVD